jgi:hypothetical protein
MAPVWNGLVGFQCVRPFFLQDYVQSFGLVDGRIEELVKEEEMKARKM